MPNLYRKSFAGSASVCIGNVISIVAIEIKNSQSKNIVAMISKSSVVKLTQIELPDW